MQAEHMDASRAWKQRGNLEQDNVCQVARSDPDKRCCIDFQIVVSPKTCKNCCT